MIKKVFNNKKKPRTNTLVRLYTCTLVHLDLYEMMYLGEKSVYNIIYYYIYYNIYNNI